MYDELIKRLGEMSEWSNIKWEDYSDDAQETMREAADAIEELKKKVDEWQETACNWNNEYYHLLDNTPRWISVEERLPEKDKYVLVRYANNDMAVACVFDGDEHMTFWRAMTDEGWCADCDTEPTHWMPLPAPPKEE